MEETRGRSDETAVTKDDDRCTHNGAYEVRQEGNVIVYYCPDCETEYTIVLSK